MTSAELIERGTASILDMAQGFFGDYIGRGCSRHVYACRFDPALVVKVVNDDNANVLEWEVWNQVQYDKDIAKWLAPCVSLSPRGDILLQRRTTPVPKAKLPAKVPAFLTDLKASNFGMLGGRIVCHDYNTLYRIRDWKGGMKKAEWFDE